VSGRTEGERSHGTGRGHLVGEQGEERVRGGYSGEGWDIVGNICVSSVIREGGRSEETEGMQDAERRRDRCAESCAETYETPLMGLERPNGQDKTHDPGTLRHRS
jgi:hypothetical protein